MIPKVGWVSCRQALRVALLTALFSGWAVAVVHAQSIVADSTVGTVVTPENGNTLAITGGTQLDTNLFHSFQKFGLINGEIADFREQ